jgi:hypothetical protein
MSKDMGGRNSSFSEKPVRPCPRRLVDWINLTGAKKVHLGPFITRPPGWVHSFFGISEDLSLRERCMREICTCSVRGGRRPARKRASSDPTTARSES